MALSKTLTYDIEQIDNGYLVKVQYNAPIFADSFSKRYFFDNAEKLRELFSDIVLEKFETPDNTTNA